jgi:hypothetical protein
VNPDGAVRQESGGHFIAVHRQESTGPVLFDGFREAQLAGAIQ